MKLLGWLIGVRCLLGTVFLSAAATAQEPGRLRVLASFFPAACVAINVGGTNVVVETLLDGRIDPHDFQFSRADLTRITGADLIVCNGLGLESWLMRPLQQARSGATVVELAAGLPSDQLIPIRDGGAVQPAESGRDTPHGRSGFNPHIWLDPRLLAHGATNVLRALQQMDRAHASEYEANTAAFLNRLAALDTELLRELAPCRHLPVVTWHDAFAYFARRYGPDVIGVIETTADVDPAPRYLADLSRRCRASRVQALFDEPGGHSRLLLRLTSDWHVPVATLNTLESGSTGPDAYFNAMRDNARIILETLR